jgi:hypothetical protein
MIAAEKETMTVESVAKILGGQVLYKGEGPGRSVRQVVASDLMSDVLLVDDDDMLLITSLASDQVLRTAQIVGAMGVVVSNGKPLPSTMIDVARSLGIPLVTAPLSKYQTCVRVYLALEAEKAEGAGGSR